MKISERAKEIYCNSLIWDILMPSGYTYVYDSETIPRYKLAGVNVVSISTAGDEGGLEFTAKVIASCQALCVKEPDKYIIIKNIEDIEASLQADKLAIFFNVQGTNVLSGNIEMIDLLYRLGVRHMSMTYNQRNLVGDGCAERTDAGLSRFGISVVKEMNRVGMLPDGTHCGYKTSMEMMEVSTSPCIFSHSNVNALYQHYRNIRDDQIIKCAAGGGVIGVAGVGFMMNDPLAHSETIFQHIDYLVHLIGPEHVGLGLDYLRPERMSVFNEYVDTHTDEWPLNNSQPHVHGVGAGPECIIELVEIMLQHQYSEKNVKGILGENFFNLCKKVWK